MDHMSVAGRQHNSERSGQRHRYCLMMESKSSIDFITSGTRLAIPRDAWHVPAESKIIRIFEAHHKRTKSRSGEEETVTWYRQDSGSDLVPHCLAKPPSRVTL